MVKIDWTFRAIDLIMIVAVIVLYYFAYKEQVGLLNKCTEQLNLINSFLPKNYTFTNLNATIVEILKNLNVSGELR
jgi:hypothetical protein